MHEVLHPNANVLISHSDYIQLAANNGYQAPNDYVGGRCPVCKRRMKVRGGHKKDDGHFYHNDNKFCPTKDPSARPYIGKTPKKVDLEAVARNRDFAITNIDRIWGRLNEMVPFLDFMEFLTILKEAKNINVYGYAGLSPEYLPYVYVTLINFLPSKSKNKQRNLKFCFFYESIIQDYGELWIDKGTGCQFSRISYQGSQTKKVAVFDMETDYLQRTSFSLSPKQRNWALDII